MAGQRVLLARANRGREVLNQFSQPYVGLGRHPQNELQFDPDEDLDVSARHAGVTREKIQENTGWPVRYAGQVQDTPEPTAEELAVLRDIQARTRKAHGGAA